MKKQAERKGVKLSYLPFIIKAVSMSINEYPILNSSLSSDENSVNIHHDHNIGIAMDTSKGLIVPNIKRVQDLSILEIAAELTRLMNDGLNEASGGFKEADLKGTTISLSNIGAIGGTYMSPVVSVPQVAIAALGKIQRLPRFKDSDHNSNDMTVESELIMSVSWGGDHRVVDGATMSRFSNTVKRILEEEGGFLGDMR